MCNALIHYINSYNTTPLSADEIESVQSIVTSKKFRRKQYFLQEGEICKFSAFIVKGAMRKYRVDDKGEEHIIRLYIENWWASDRESMTTSTPSRYFIDAWEDTECLLVSEGEMAGLADRIPAIRQWIRKLDLNFAIAAQKRIEAAISLSAEDRFYHIEKTYPEFVQRFPQHIIASYLGVNRETLSRVRCRHAKKSSSS
jgi:CRP-like cAMP-binding protein